MIQIYLLRHAHSLQNGGKDRPNCDLSKRGKKQTKNLSRQIKDIHFDYILSSPLLRCQETIRLSKISYSNFRSVDLLREYKEDLCDFFHDETPFQRETLDEFKDRVRQLDSWFREFYEHISSDKDTSAKILIVAHYNVFYYWKNLSLENAELVCDISAV